MTAINVDCSYNIWEWTGLGNTYTCQVQNSLSITTPEETVITSNSGKHNHGRSNENVHGLSISGTKVNYFPRGIKDVFKNIKGIEITRCHLKQVTQDDLKMYPDLVYLYLAENDIKVLEAGLFEFNPKLKVISLSQNEISKIHPQVFDNLNQLMHLWIRSNTCIDMLASDEDEVRDVVQQIKAQCSNSASKIAKRSTKLFSSLNPYA